MKKLLLLCIFFCTTHTTFEFIDYKSQGALSKQFINEIIRVFQPNIFFETGTYSGATTHNAASFFKEIYTVELDQRLYQSAKRKLASYKHIQIFNDKSANTITRLASQLDGTVVFWLDAHYSGNGTAMTFDDQTAAKAITPIREELKAIEEADLDNCIILIDDMRGFGITISGEEYLGCWAYPTIQEIRDQLYRINGNFNIMLLGDILLAYDQTKYNPSFSETVQACTKTRLYDGYNVSDAELIACEQTIMHAPEHEKKFIKHLYSSMTEYRDPMFWHDLWYGLAELGSHNYTQAYEALCKVKIRKNKLNNDAMPHMHPRIDTYISMTH